MRKENEKPIEIRADKSYLPLYCNGNGFPLENTIRTQRMAVRWQSHAPACPVTIAADQPIFILRWSTSPHMTIHCPACREHFFGVQRTLNLGEEPPKP